MKDSLEFQDENGMCLLFNKSGDKFVKSVYIFIYKKLLLCLLNRYLFMHLKDFIFIF